MRDHSVGYLRKEVIHNNLCDLVGLLQRVTEKQNQVNIGDRMWARLLSSTNQPAFIKPHKEVETKKSAQGSNDHSAESFADRSENGSVLKEHRGS